VPLDDAPADAGARHAPSLAPRLHALLDFVQAVAGARGYNELLKVMAREGTAALEASAVSLSIWERDRGRLRTLINHGEGSSLQEDQPVEEVYLLAQEDATRRMLIDNIGYVMTVDDPAGDPGVRKVLEDLGKHSCLAVPVPVEGKVWGELFATRTVLQQPFTQEDLDFATIVALQVGAGVAQAENLARVELLAYTDDLTSLANRRAFEDALDDAIAAHRENGVAIGLVVADVNGLKRLNDREGHANGDAGLIAFASELSAAVAAQASSMAARLGGDEFCVLTTGLDADTVVALATDICRRAETVLEEGVACGVASTDELPAVEITPANLLRAADVAQYRAKRSGFKRPVVAGRTQPELEQLPFPLDDGERRLFRGRGKLPPAFAVDAILAELDTLPDRAWQERLAAVGTVVAGMLDGAGWVVSSLPKGATTLRSTTSQEARRGRPLGYFEAEDYLVDEYPSTFAALGGRAVVVDVDDARSDQREVELLVMSGLSEMVMCGGSDQDGNRWLLEVLCDELSAPVRPYVSVMAAGVALALRW
jgi:diguanylate cyclase (GGDEF)-like protein